MATINFINFVNFVRPGIAPNGSCDFCCLYPRIARLTESGKSQVANHVLAAYLQGVS